LIRWRVTQRHIWEDLMRVTAVSVIYVAASWCIVEVCHGN
jgi:hypothetical protein